MKHSIFLICYRIPKKKIVNVDKVDRAAIVSEDVRTGRIWVDSPCTVHLSVNKISLGYHYSIIISS